MQFIGTGEELIATGMAVVAASVGRYFVTDFDYLMHKVAVQMSGIEKKETAQEIGRILAAVARRADEAELYFLAYLIRIAETEARSKEAKGAE